MPAAGSDVVQYKPVAGSLRTSTHEHGAHICGAMHKHWAGPHIPGAFADVSVSDFLVPCLSGGLRGPDLAVFVLVQTLFLACTSAELSFNTCLNLWLPINVQGVVRHQRLQLRPCFLCCSCHVGIKAHSFVQQTVNILACRQHKWSF